MATETFTLDPANGFAAGKNVVIVNSRSLTNPTTLIVAKDAGDTFEGLATDFSLPPLSAITVQSDGVSAWQVVMSCF